MTTALALPLAGPLDVTVQRERTKCTACHMAREYQQATAEIARLALAINAQTARLAEALHGDPDTTYNPFDIRLSYDGDHYITLDEADLAGMFGKMKRKAWQVLIQRLGIQNIMSVAKRRVFEEQLKRGELPDINEQTITGIILGLAQQARDFAKDAAREVFDILRPRKGWGGDYKTNDPFRVGRKVILTWYVERCWDGKKFRVNYHRQAELTAIDGVFHVLDGKGVMRENKGPLTQAIEASEDGRGETDYFRFRCFKNRNLHLEMKRLDLVKELNLHATGEAVLGHDMTE
jgi:hypothetical protein